MNELHPLLTETTAPSISRGVVLGLRNEEIAVSVDDDDPSQPVHCILLQLADDVSLQLAAGDPVLVWRPAPDALNGVILGRLGPSRAPLDVLKGDLPDDLVIEAKQSLTLRVGDGSITIREDGKILIKGKDLVSHATRTNRIKGGSVQIN